MALVPLNTFPNSESRMEEVVGFSLSDRASFVNGQMVPIEGGLARF